MQSKYQGPAPAGNGRLYIASPIDLVPLRRMFFAACSWYSKWMHVQIGKTLTQKSPPVIGRLSGAQKVLLWSPKLQAILFLEPRQELSVLITFLVSNFHFRKHPFFFFPVRWFCHFDDDNYVNVPTLVKTLQNFNPHEDVYLGKPSLLKAMEVIFRNFYGQMLS